MNLKQMICGAALVVALALNSQAGVNFASGTGATNTLNVGTNYLVFPATGLEAYQFVLYSANYRNATNATLSIASGKAAFTQTQTNLSSSTVTNMVNTTNGLVPGSLLVLEHAGVGYVAALSAIGQSTNANTFGTNIVLATGGWGVNASAGDQIYQLDTATQLILAPGTNQVNGSAIFVGNQGRPVVLMLGPALTPSYLTGTGEWK